MNTLTAILAAIAGIIVSLLGAFAFGKGKGKLQQQEKQEASKKMVDEKRKEIDVETSREVMEIVKPVIGKGEGGKVTRREVEDFSNEGLLK